MAAGEQLTVNRRGTSKVTNSQLLVDAGTFVLNNPQHAVAFRLYLATTDPQVRVFIIVEVECYFL